MLGWFGNKQVRRREVRKQLAQHQKSVVNRLVGQLWSWPVLLRASYCAAAVAIALLGRQSFPWVAGAVAAGLLAFFTGMFVASRYEARLGQAAREVVALRQRADERRAGHQPRTFLPPRVGFGGREGGP